MIAKSESVNSLRIYKTVPDYENPTSGVFAVFYPKKASVLDIMDLTPKVKHWINTTNLTMGNWTSKEEILQDLNAIKLDEVPAYDNEIPMDSLNELLKNNSKVVVIGFDILQVPRFKIVYELEK